VYSVDCHGYSWLHQPLIPGTLSKAAAQVCSLSKAGENM